MSIRQLALLRRGLPLWMCLVAAAGQAADAPTREQVRSATIAGVYDQPVTLAEGVYEGPPFVAGGAARPRLMLTQDLVVVGDLDGVAGDEVAALLSESSGGSGERVWLAVIGVREGRPVSLGTAQVGDRVRIRSFGVVGANLVLAVIEAGPNDPACCPTQAVRKTYRLENGSLTLTGTEVTGTLSLALIDATEWTAVEIDGQALPEGDGPPTVRIEGDRIAGFSGCNRYMARIRETGPGEVSIGPLAGTRMACPGPGMALEDRFLLSLGKGTRYTFFAGQLLLTGMDGDLQRTLLLAPGAAQ